MFLAKVKLGTMIIAEVGLILAATVPDEFTVEGASNPLWAISFVIAALALLLLIIRKLLDGDLVSKSNIQAVVSQAVNEALNNRRDIQQSQIDSAVEKAIKKHGDS